MMAQWNNTVLAESDEAQFVDGRYFFPPNSINYRHFKASDTHTTDPKGGLANYYTLDVDGHRLPDGAWFYPAPLDLDDIAGYITFAPEVTIDKTPA